MNVPPSLNAQDLKAQQATRNMVVRDRRIIIGVMIGGSFLLLLLAIVLSPRYPSYIVILPIIVFYFAMRGVINWRQWAALRTYQVRCPHCGKQVAERISLVKSPTPQCPHCGKRALATLDQLQGK